MIVATIAAAPLPSSSLRTMGSSRSGALAWMAPLPGDLPPRRGCWQQHSGRVSKVPQATAPIRTSPPPPLASLHRSRNLHRSPGQPRPRRPLPLALSRLKAWSTLEAMVLLRLCDLLGLDLPPRRGKATPRSPRGGDRPPPQCQPPTAASLIRNSTPTVFVQRRRRCTRSAAARRCGCGRSHAGCGRSAGTRLRQGFLDNWRRTLEQ